MKHLDAICYRKLFAAIVVCADPSQSPLWLEDCAIAAVSMQYAACAQGLASRWAQMRGNRYNDAKTSRDYIAELIDLPPNLEVECLIGIGYPGEEIIPYKKEELATQTELAARSSRTDA